MQLDATVGSPTANAYVTVAVASDFLEGRLHTAPWFGVEGDQEVAEVSIATREAALIWATQILEDQVRWGGLPATTTQALAWPRSGMRDHLGRPVLSTLVPVPVQRATAFLALELLRDAREAPENRVDAGLKSKKLGDMTVVFQDRPVVGSAFHGIPADIRAMLRLYGTLAGSLAVPLLRT